MSLYNALFGTNPASGIGMAMLGNPDVGRFRDCYFCVDGETGEYQIVVYTRNGGGNREEYQDVFDTLRRHPLYVRDEDDAFDCTYASIFFRVPEAYRDDVAALVSELPEEAKRPPAERFASLIQKLEASKPGEPSRDPEVKRAMAVGSAILGEVRDTLGRRDD